MTRGTLRRRDILLVQISLLALPDGYCSLNTESESRDFLATTSNGPPSPLATAAAAAAPAPAVSDVVVRVELVLVVVVVVVVLGMMVVVIVVFVKYCLVSRVFRT